MNGNARNFLFWAMLVLLALSLYQMAAPSMNAVQKEKATYSDIMNLVDEGAVSSIQIKGQTISALRSDGQALEALAPYDPDLIKNLRNKNVAIEVKPKEGESVLKQILISMLPIGVIILFWIVMMNKMQGGGKAMSFGKSKAQMLTENQIRVTFDDVAGVEEAKQELEEVVDFLKEPTKFQRLGGKIPKGVLLMGSPGTGKTLLARSVAGEAGVPFFTISGSEFVEMFVGVGASRVRDLFEQAKKNSPCIVFIDEIDAVGRHRGTGIGGGNDEREQTLNQLLVEMDGFGANEGVILIAATNRPDVLDPALMRPGRFDRQVVVPLPDILGRAQILKVHMQKVPLASDVDAHVIARGTPGFSGADLANLVNESALMAARSDKRLVDMEDFEMAKDKVMMGAERKSNAMTEDQKKTTAYHEAGHAIVTLFIDGEADPLHKVTIIPRGRALGVTMSLPEEDKVTYDKEYLENQIAILMGGRLAEELILNQKTTGASNDIERATELAHNMVCAWGMSDKMGPQIYGTKEHDPFLGRSMGGGGASGLSSETAKAVDAEVSKFIDTNYKRAKSLLIKRNKELHQLSEALLEYETLDREQIDNLLAGKPVIAKKGSRRKQKAEAELKVKKESRVKRSETKAKDTGSVKAKASAKKTTAKKPAVKKAVSKKPTPKKTDKK
ncbi:MAG: cell division protease FtsH [Alphaproteobacteria bacterium]